MAEHLAGSETEFVRQMNERAKGLGMTNTQFEDCSGLTDSTTHLTSARDVAIMSRELVTRYPEIHKYSTIWMENITHVTQKGSSEFGLANTNKLLKQYQWTTGLKTGSHSLAKYCLSATAKKDGVDLIAVIMAAPDYKVRFAEAVTLLNYGYANCKLYRDTAPPVLENVPISDGVKDELALEYGGSFSYLSTTGEDFGRITSEMVLDPEISAPMELGDRVGSLHYKLGEKEIGSVDILAAEGIRAAGYADYLKKVLNKFLMTD